MQAGGVTVGSTLHTNYRPHLLAVLGCNLDMPHPIVRGRPQHCMFMSLAFNCCHICQSTTTCLITSVMLGLINNLF